VGQTRMALSEGVQNTVSGHRRFNSQTLLPLQ